MNGAQLLGDGFGRVRDELRATVEGLTTEQLGYRPTPEANSIGWLAWHLTRIQDDHVADVAGTEQVWTAAGWSDEFGLPFDVSATGFGHSSADVAAVRVRPEQLLGYYDAVHDRTVEFLSGLTDDDFDRIVDPSWDPPVSLGARLVSVLTDDLEHLGQAAYVRGMLPH
ncbi:mycothiol transferase [Plantactinospora sp. DSM 117369]